MCVAWFLWFELNPICLVIIAIITIIFVIDFFFIIEDVFFATTTAHLKRHSPHGKSRSIAPRIPTPQHHAAELQAHGEADFEAWAQTSYRTNPDSITLVLGKALAGRNQFAALLSRRRPRSITPRKSSQKRGIQSSSEIGSASIK